MAKRSTLQRSGQAGIYNFLVNEVLASQLGGDYVFHVVSPWVTNFALATPYHVSFQEIVATRQDSLHLFDVLHQLAANGGRVQITVGDDANLSPLRRLAERSDRIEVRVLSGLHAKVYAGRFGAMDGSLNLTGSGVNQNLELYSYYYNEQSVAERRRVCAEYFERAVPL
jgi:hypothetical protein